MKKIILVAILFSGCVAFTNAQTASEPQNAPKEQVAQADDGFKEVALTDLSAPVQDAVKALAGDAFDVKKVELNADKGLTKVTLSSKSDATVKLVLLDKDGKEVKPEAAPAK